MNNIDTIKLDNGLTIYFYEDKRKHSTLFQFITLFGGATKDFKIDGKQYHIPDGVAHILEHYIVEANQKGNFLELLGERQMNTNASTHINMTEYYFEAVEDLDFGIETLINGIYHPIFDEEKLEKVKGPIYQEIRSRKDNKFYHSNIETLNNLFFDIGFRNVGGTLEEVSSVDLEMLKLCYEAFYQPSNQFIVIGGNFDKDHILNLIKNIYKNIDIKKHDIQLIKVKERDIVKKKKSEIVFPTGEEYREISYKINLRDFSAKDKLKLDFYIHNFYNMFFGVSSSLYKELVEEKIITTSINCSDILIDDFIIVSIGAYSSKIDVLEKRIMETIKNINDFDEETFELDKRVSLLRIILRSENLVDFLLPFVDNIVNYNYPFPDKKEDIEELNFDDFKEMIKSLDFSNYTITTIKDK